MNSEIEKDTFPLLNLPHVVMSQLLNLFTYDEIANLRAVNRRFNEMCSSRLNHGFRLVEKFHTKCLREVKSELPRRESERRSHRLARHCDILTAIETRISLLAMTFMKYVDIGMCCFIPGKVIDEIFAVLRTIKKDKCPPKAYEILQELRDISSMAMEHFDEKIVPTLVKQMPQSADNSVISGASSIMSPFTSQNLRSLPAIFVSSSPASTSSVGFISNQHNTPSARLSLMEKKLEKRGRSELKYRRSLQKLVLKQNKIVKYQKKKLDQLEECLVSHQTLLDAQAEKIKDQEAKLIDLNRKMLESEQKLNEFRASRSTLSDSSFDESKASNCQAKNRKRNRENPENHQPDLAKKFKK